MPLLLENRAATLSPLPLITTEEARMTRVSLSSSTWLRVRKGIYTNRGSYASAKPWIRYQVRVHAFARQHPDAILCLESAAVIHGIPLFGETRDIHVYSPDRKRARCTPQTASVRADSEMSSCTPASTFERWCA
ncbi:MAG: hypothetical protein ACTH8F_04200 [Microbacterium sp.]|uniref:hypothetical protein n=1 Tax=Microbacterium sp. TaxID=51671 RepID=UPI003F945A3D